MTDEGNTHAVAVARQPRYDIAADTVEEAAALIVTAQGFPVTIAGVPKTAQAEGIGWLMSGAGGCCIAVTL